MEKNNFTRPFRDGERNYKERFQFVYSVNDNIICQRYFRINGFNLESLNSLELKDALDDCVRALKNDLQAKSRVYMWYTTVTPVQLTGFKGDVEPEYLTYPKESMAQQQEDELLQPYEVMFSFKFMMDNKTVYEYIWDGTRYPKYVRNSVDITNSGSIYRDRDQMMLSFSQYLNKAMTADRHDLAFYIIKKICEVTSGGDDRRYSKYETYGDKEYAYNSYNKRYVNEWRKHTMKKTLEYFDGNIPSKS